VADAAHLIEQLRTLEADDPEEVVLWEVRQTVWSRTAR